jgi:hypothetical protein
MLSEALLSGLEYPEITLVGECVDDGRAVLDRHTAPDASAVAADAQARVLITVRGQEHSIVIPLRYELQNGRATVSGDVPIKQSDLGLRPFNALLGALQVQDEIRVRFRFVARAAT